jgi:endonuclease YncB( thermonuclease family)
MGLCQSLESRTFENTPEFTFEGQSLFGKVVQVYDGDTIWVVIKIRGTYNRVKVRLNGIDAPELKPSLKVENRNKIIKLAEESKEFLSNLILNKIVTLKCHKYDKYGRLLADLFLEDKDKQIINISEHMIKNKKAYPYDGNKKIEIIFNDKHK